MDDLRVWPGDAGSASSDDSIAVDSCACILLFHAPSAPDSAVPTLWRLDVTGSGKFDGARRLSLGS